MPATTPATKSASLLSGPVLQAAGWMLLGGACFAATTGIVRHVSAGLDPIQIVFFRCLFGLIAMLPFVMRAGFHTLHSARPSLHLIRAGLAVFAMIAWFKGVSVVPLADATALNFMTPLFASIVAVLLLGETMRLRRWSATAIGFGGAMIILRPGLIEITPGVAMVLAATVLMAFGPTLIRMITRTDHPNAVVFWLAFLVTPCSLVPALFVWQTPTWPELLWMLILGSLATIGHQAHARAFSSVELTVVLPLQFLRLPFAALIGYVAFVEIPDTWTWVGAAVIVASSVYIAHREAKLRRLETARPVAGTGADPL